MADITLNSAVRSNLRTLQSTTDLMNRTENRLSTGKKVNSALDNPSNFFTSQALDRRASDLNGLLDSVSSSVKTLEAADNGITAITDVVESLKATARSALQSSQAITSKASTTSTLTTSTDYSLIGLKESVTGSVGGLSGASTLTGTGGGALTVNGTAVTYLAGATTESVLTSINAISGVRASLDDTGALKIESLDGNGVNLTSVNAQTQADLGLPASSTVNALGAAGTNSLTFTVGTGSSQQTRSVTFGTGANQVSSLSELNTALEAASLTATVGSDGKLKVSTTNAAATKTFTVTGNGASGTFGAATTNSTAPSFGDGATRATRDGFRDDFNRSLKQIDSLAKDSSFNGVNLLASDDLSVTFNEDGSSKLDVGGVNFDFAGLGLSELSASGTDFYDSDSINAVIDNLDAALSKLESQSSKFGSQLQIVETRESFTKDMIGTLEDGALALVGADTNEEAANLATLQTRQALIVSSLSISTSQESNVLQLLR